MECATILTPTLKLYSAFHQRPILLKEPNMKRYQHFIDVQGEVLPTHTAQRQLLRPLNNLENGSFRNIKNLQ